MIHNMVGGGAGVKLPGIFVTYPSDSTCTCTNGTTTYTAKGTSGFWFFSGLAVGTWTVKATNGTDSASQSVNITAEGQSVSVTLSYWNGELFNNGNQFTDVTGGWERNTAFYCNHANSGGTVTIGDTLYFDITAVGSVVINTANAVDLTNYSTLNMELTTIREKVKLGVSETKSGDISSGLNVKTTKTGTVSYDISSLSGNYYIYIGDINYTGATIPRVWLS